MEEKTTEKSRQAYRAICKNVKKTFSENISKHEYDFVNFPSQLAFYKYVNNKLGQSNHLPMGLINDKGN